MLIVRQFNDELFKLFARKRTYIGFGAFVVLQVMILALLQHPRAKASIAELLEQNGLGFDDHYMGLTLAIVVIAFSFTFLGGLYVALIAGDIVAKEVEDGTMRMILSRPIGRVRLLMIKFAACVLYTLVLVCFLGVTALCCASLYRGGLGKLFIFFPDEELFAFYDAGEGLWRYTRSIACLSFATLTIAAMGFMFSCFKMKPAAATILTLSVFFVDVVLMNLPYFAELRHLFMSYHIGFWVRTYHAYPPWHEIVQSVAWLVGLMSTFVVVGVTHFAGRDLKG
ncbi:ABC transporter permease subunit [Algisphaera agarilytica]|uniref:ABC-2 type transport system permease protein n=1 Tax=Algisphaera agarilytica TaxID=1385975 RepID=A0A7X0LJE9_9BACT|nr:ABC transporter permease subunit [Algisphaera agarilytica]MBB6428536.1 ABC-2 type transport system permease protein [Algisphaera agarilytica]